MNKHFLRMVTVLLICLVLISTVFSVAASRLNKVVVVGSIDPSLGYDEIVNGTTTFHVARSRPVSETTFYHNVTKLEWKHSSMETSPETPSSYYDNLTGKYYYDTLVAEPYELTVPDPSGKVTVFSNMVFQGTGWNPKSKSILHPDGTSQSILHVKGQASGDPHSRYLVVTIYNSKYPSGYQVDYTVVASSFDKSYDVTNIVAERDVNTISIVVTTYVGKWDVQSYFWVSTVGTDVYIVMIPDVPTWYVSDMEAVRRGVEKACMVTPLVHLDTWKGLTYLEVVDMSTYEYIIQYPENVKPPGFYGETGIIVVNAHGEVLPVQPGCYWETWVRVIRQHVQRKALTWVQVGGYPFYYYSYGSHVKTEVGPQGFQLFLEMILGPNSIDCWPNQEGYAVPLQGGYSNRLWGYGLIGGGLHEGRPLKIDSSTNIADLLDVMGYRSGGIEYLTLGLIGFAYPNQNLTPDQQVGYYVHNGANWYDSDYNKGKYSMATAAWTKISVLAIDYVDVHAGARGYWGSLKCEVAWSYAVPPQGSTDPWKIVFVTTTIATMKVYQYVITAMAPLKITRSSSTTTFQFVSGQSTTLYDLSQNSWQDTIAQGFIWTTIAVILIPFTGGIWTAVAVTVGLGFTSTVTTLAFESPSPVTSGSYIDLALEDKSEVPVEDSDGNEYMQVSSYGVTEAYVAQSPNGGASETLDFTLGQKGLWYMGGDQTEWLFDKTLPFHVPITVEPYTSADANSPPLDPATPSGPTSGYKDTAYTYFSSMTDPDGDDVRYIFYWGDGSSTTTNWYESGNTVSASHQWSNPGIYQVQVQAQDCQGAYSALSSSLAVTIVNRAPNTPSQPSGPTYGYRNVWYTYSTSTTDPDGDNVRYQFEFTGPSTDVSFTTGWYASGETGSLTVMWETTDPPGTYHVRVRAQDVYGLWSSWSPSLTVNIVNRAPNTPSTPSGPTSGYTGTSYSYSTSTTDPDGDNVYYLFDWGGGSTTTIGPYASGATVSASNTWGSTGTYDVKVKAKDVYGLWSGYSSSLTVTISSGGGGGGGGCPTLFVWDGSAFAEEGLLDIHAESDVTMTWMIHNTLALENGLYRLQLRELDNYTSHIDYVKLYAVDNQGNWHECTLEGNGNAVDKLLYDDGNRLDLPPGETIDLKFSTTFQGEIAYFIFEINGYNRKPLLR